MQEACAFVCCHVACRPGAEGTHPQPSIADMGGKPEDVSGPPVLRGWQAAGATLLGC